MSANQDHPEGSGRSKIVAVTIGFFVLLVLTLLFLKRKPVEERIKDVESDLRDEDGMVKILDGGQRGSEQEGTGGQKGFLSRFLRLLKWAFVGVFLIIVLAVVIFFGCLVFNPSICRKKRERQSPPGLLESLNSTVFVVIWLGASLVVFVCHLLIWKVRESLEACLGWKKQRE